MDIVVESVYWPVGQGEARLHARRFRPTGAAAGAPVLMLHGAIENARIFYSDSGRGLAPYLARAGLDVFACDLRGRGASTPKIDRRAAYGQTEAITEDLTAMARGIDALTGHRRQHWLGHSWGGVLAASHLTRFPERAAAVATLTCFGTKRRVGVVNLQRLVGIDLMWNRVAPAIAALYGYFPAKALRFGADSETRGSLGGSVAWVRRAAAWVDPIDGFDYGNAVQRVTLPPALHLAGVADRYLGNPDDVRWFMEECGTPPEALVMLGRAYGNRHDYGHIDMLTHPDAVSDHFPRVRDWLLGL